MPSAATVWLSALLFSSAIFASPLVAERFEARSPSIRTGLYSKASIPRAATANQTCASADPDPDPNAGPIGDEQMVCTVHTANLNLCTESNGCVGTATFYNISQGVTACGGYYDNSTLKAALSSDYVMGLLSDGSTAGINPYCNVTSITVKYGSKSVPKIQVVDKCASCKSVGHIDLSPGAYNALGADEAAGHVPISWFFDSAGS